MTLQLSISEAATLLMLFREIEGLKQHTSEPYGTHTDFQHVNKLFALSGSMGVYKDALTPVAEQIKSTGLKLPPM
jgi:hypothetical protein